MSETALTYSLDARAIRARSRATAAIASLATFTPSILVVVLLVKMGFILGVFAIALLALGAALAVARSFAHARSLASSLRAFVLTLHPDAIEVRTKRRALHIEASRITRVREIAGTFGGIRVEVLPDLASGDETEWFDIPRGGSGFGDIRAHLESWRPIDRPSRRARASRVAIVFTIVLSIFFVPFLLDDVIGRSRAAAFALVAIVWLAIRFAMRRSS